MTTIVLPAVRRDTVNLFRHQVAGNVTTGTGSAIGFADSLTPMHRVVLADVGLAVGDVISASAEIMNVTDGDSIAVRLSFFTAAGAGVSGSNGSFIDVQEFTRATVENVTIPATTAYIQMTLNHASGTGSCSIRKGMVNRGATAAAYEIPKRGAWAPIVHAMLARDNDQSVQRYLSGASQITSYPSRRWMLQFATHVLEGDELREWSLALDQLSDLGNVFRFVPPEYEGPSTGYEGPMPAVNGASQTGTSLVCDGVTASTDILGPGDYVSFEVTTAKSNTNVELHRIASLATSDASGNVTLTFTRPIRQAPADNAVIQCYAPTAQFRFVAPRAGTDLQLMRRTPISVEAEEAVFL